MESAELVVEDLLGKLDVEDVDGVECGKRALRHAEFNGAIDVLLGEVDRVGDEPEVASCKPPENSKRRGDTNERVFKGNARWFLHTCFRLLDQHKTLEQSSLSGLVFPSRSDVSNRQTEERRGENKGKTNGNPHVESDSHSKEGDDDGEEGHLEGFSWSSSNKQKTKPINPKEKAVVLERRWS